MNSIDTKKIDASKDKFFYAKQIVLFKKLKDNIENGIIDNTKLINELINYNLWLIYSIASKFEWKWLEYEDLVQEWIFWLRKAILKFDHEKWNKFSTYANWWIKQSIKISIYNTWKTIRIPVHKNEIISRFKSVYMQLLKTNHTAPNVEEIAKELYISKEKVREIMEITNSTLSLNAQIWNNESSTLIDLIKNNEQCLEIQTDATILKEKLNQILDSFNPKKRKLIIMRFWLNWEKEHTLREIWKTFWVSRERIRQIEAQIFRKLRVNSQINALKDF